MCINARQSKDSSERSFSHSKDKDALYRMSKRFRVLDYDFFNSKSTSTQYLKLFTRDYLTVIQRWMRWSIPADLSATYWEKCLKILDS